MKKILFAICGAAVLFTGCKEHDQPLIIVQSVDSSYVVTPAPAAEAHNVLIEEFTGQTCSNCPAAHAELEGIASSHPAGSVNIIGMYLYNIPQAVPDIGTSKYDFRDSTATNISTAIYGGVNQLPGAGIDRVPGSTGLQLGSGDWPNAVNTRLAVTTPVNLHVQSSYSAATGTATITVFVTYTSSVSTAQNLSVVVVEDSMVDIQEEPLFGAFPSGYDSSYLFTNVFRGMVSSPPVGDPILATIPIKQPGQVDRRIYTYKPKVFPPATPAINVSRCRVIAFVNNANGSDKQVVQSAQCKLAP